MGIDVETLVGAPIRGGGRTSRTGRVIAVPFGPTSTPQVLLGGPAYLMGWSIKESTGTGLAIVELVDGGGASGVLVACIDLDAAADPAGSQTPADSTSSGSNAQQVATITPGAGITAFIQSLRITGLGATAAVEVTAVLAGVLGGSINYPVSVPAGVAVPIAPVEDTFPGRGLAGSAPAQAITLTLPAFGAGNTLESASIQGYLQGTSATAQSQTLSPDGVLLQAGLFLNILSGSIRGAVWIRQ